MPKIKDPSFVTKQVLTGIRKAVEGCEALGQTGKIQVKDNRITFKLDDGSTWDVQIYHHRH